VDALVAPDMPQSHHKHHHKHHSRHHKHGHSHQKDDSEGQPADVAPQVTDGDILARLQMLDTTLDKAESKAEEPVVEGKLEVNAPLPADFAERFAKAVARATGARADEVKMTGAAPVKGQQGLDEVEFQADKRVVDSVLVQAADPSSKLSTGTMHSFLIAKDDGDAVDTGSTEDSQQDAGSKDGEQQDTGSKEEVAQAVPPTEPASGAAPLVDMMMPFGDLEPFGREDTASDLTQASIRESNAMVDQLERAEVAEEKRAVFRALTRLRGAAITSFDGVARAQTGNIDEYARTHRWLEDHPVRHLAQEEADVQRWAFPAAAGF